MTYWVYEDNPTDRVRVHKATCSRCNDVQGVKGSRRSDNRCRGSFGTEREAIDCALSTGRLDAGGCWFCLRSMASSIAATGSFSHSVRLRLPLPGSAEIMVARVGQNRMEVRTGLCWQPAKMGQQRG